MSDLALYYSPGACSLAPHIALEETGLPFEARRVDFAAAEQRSPAYLALNPKGRVPVLVRDGFALTENPAILRFVARLGGDALWPAEAEAEARCAEWLAWCSSGLHVAYAHVRRPERYGDSEGAREEIVGRGRLTVREAWEAVERRLAASPGPWLLGERYTVADPSLFVFWNWGRGSVLGFDVARDFPAWTAHARRMGERPAVRAVLAREGLRPV